MKDSYKIVSLIADKSINDIGGVGRNLLIIDQRIFVRENFYLYSVFTSFFSKFQIRRVDSRMRITATSMANELVALFTSIGLTEQKSKETLKNKDVSERLKEVINEVCICQVLWKSALWFPR
jgi:hypothetical protein